MLATQRDGLGESVGEKMHKHAWRAGKAAVLAILAGCAAAPPDDRPTFSWKWEVALTDSCEELAGFLAMMDLFGIFGIDWGSDMVNATTEVQAEMEKRCPDDVEPEALNSTFSIPDHRLHRSPQSRGHGRRVRDGDIVARRAEDRGRAPRRSRFGDREAVPRTGLGRRGTTRPPCLSVVWREDRRWVRGGSCPRR